MYCAENRRGESWHAGNRLEGHRDFYQVQGINNPYSPALRYARYGLGILQVRIHAGIRMDKKYGQQLRYFFQVRLRGRARLADQGCPGQCSDRIAQCAHG